MLANIITLVALFLAGIIAHDVDLSHYGIESAEDISDLMIRDTTFIAESYKRMAKLTEEEKNITPQQLHLSLVNDPAAMLIMWITNTRVPRSGVYYWADNSSPSSALYSDAEWTTYTAGLDGWTGSIYTATMRGLIPGKKYKYSVGGGVPYANNTAYWSTPRTFKNPVVPSANSTVLIGVVADQGTIVPMGFKVAERLASEHLTSGTPFDMVLLAGDLSYASVSPPKYEVQWTWDSFGIQQEPFAATAPFMVTVGNHEKNPGTYTRVDGSVTSEEFAAYTARYRMPGTQSKGNQNFWYSFDFGPIHFCSISSEHDFKPGSDQHNWIVDDLIKANANRRATPWIIVSIHRPIFSSTDTQKEHHIPGGEYPMVLGALMDRFKVDLVIQGHYHGYERTHAISYDGTVVQMADCNRIHYKPEAPVYIVTATSGALLYTHTEEAPFYDWLAFRDMRHYGHGRLYVEGAKKLVYTFVDTDGWVQDEFTIVK